MLIVFTDVLSKTGLIAFARPRPGAPGGTPREPVTALPEPFTVPPLGKNGSVKLLLRTFSRHGSDNDIKNRRWELAN